MYTVSKDHWATGDEVRAVAGVAGGGEEAAGKD